MAEAIGTIAGGAKWTPNAGVATPIPLVTSMSTDAKQDNPTYVAAENSGVVARVPGPEDESGSVGCLADAATALSTVLALGDIGTMAYFADLSGTAEHTVTAAIISGVAMEFNPATGEPLGLTVTWDRYGSALPTP